MPGGASDLELEAFLPEEESPSTNAFPQEAVVTRRRKMTAVLLLLSVFGLALVALHPSNVGSVSNLDNSATLNTKEVVSFDEEKDTEDDEEKDEGNKEAEGEDDDKKGDEKKVEGDDKGSEKVTSEENDKEHSTDDDATNGDKKEVKNTYKCGAPLVKTDQTAVLQKEYAAWKKKWVKSVKGGMCIKRPPGDVSGNPKYENDCVSEGNGYGLLLSAYLDDKETFKGIWEFMLTYKDKQGNMHWQILPDAEKPIVGKGSATDVDEDTAMALIVAAERWGGEYPSLAKEQIERVWKHDIQKSDHAVMAGDEWGSCKTIDVSYFSPAWYGTFAKVTGDKKWEDVIDWGFKFLSKCNKHNNGTGLTPQWTDCECENSKKIGKYPDQYWCDASRVPWRMGVSAAWHCNEAALKQAKLLATFFSKQGGAAKIQNGYTLDGKPLHTKDIHNACTESCFITMAAAAIAVDDSMTDDVKVDFWNTSLAMTGEKQSCYYCDALRVLSLLFTSGLMHEPQVKL